MRRAARLAIVLPVTAIALFLISVVAICAASQKRAREIIEDLNTLSAADNPSKQFESFYRKYGNDIKHSEPCTSEHCSYKIGVNNRFFTMLHLANYAEMTTAFQFDRGYLSFTNTQYRFALRNGISPVVNVQEDYCQGKCPAGFNLSIDPHGRRSTNASNGMVEFNGSGNGQERDVTRSFNLRCLSPFATCKDIADLLPNVWERNPDGSIRCRFHTAGDSYDDWK
jgi:hypothetical protein